MDISFFIDLGKGILLILLVILYLKYFNHPNEKLKDNNQEQLISKKLSAFSSKISQYKVKLSVYFLIIIGVGIIYNTLAKYIDFLPALSNLLK